MYWQYHTCISQTTLHWQYPTSSLKQHCTVLTARAGLNFITPLALFDSFVDWLIQFSRKLICQNPARGRKVEKRHTEGKRTAYFQYQKETAMINNSRKKRHHLLRNNILSFQLIAACYPYHRTPTSLSRFHRKNSVTALYLHLPLSTIILLLYHNSTISTQ